MPFPVNDISVSEKKKKLEFLVVSTHAVKIWSHLKKN